MKISIASLNLFTRENSLRQLFEKYGNIQSINIKKDDGLKISKGQGVINMSCKEAAMKAIQHLNGTLLDGKNIIVKPM